MAVYFKKYHALWFLPLLIYLFSTVSARNPFDDVVLEIKALFNKNTTVRELFVTNVEENAVVMQFQIHSGLICYAVFDFNNNVKIFKLDVLGEPELGQKQYLSMCFVSKLKKEDFIPADAMAKLRQKTSGSVQEANDMLKPEDFLADIEFKNIAGLTSILGEKFSRLCYGRESIVYTKESELLSLANDDPVTYEALRSHASKTYDSTLPVCSYKTKLTVKTQPCSCKIPFSIPWFPCFVKYCTTKNSQGHTVTTRCGIRSCGATYYLRFIANNPLACHWGVT